jgi:outer membrane receptor for ferrienterochelin and colicins
VLLLLFFVDYSFISRRSLRLYSLVVSLSALASVSVWAQTPSPLTGQVVVDQSATAAEPLPGASVFWLGTRLGTAADAQGTFSLPYPPGAVPWRLVVRFLGFQTDTLTLSRPATAPLRVALRRTLTLGEARVEGRAVTNSATSIGQMQTISARDLTKSACCNLAESFETNASVEVSTTDAVSGARQIQLLGLDGAYSLLTVDNQPALRGLATPYRLNYLAGPWIEAVDIIKGAGSVINGYEAISGQVNVRLKEPDKAERLLINAYANDLGKVDFNVVAATPLTKHTTAELLLHTDHLGRRADRNADGFLDLPLATQYNGLAKWKYKPAQYWVVELGGGALRETRVAGQRAYRASSDDPLTAPTFGIESTTNRLTTFAKASYTFAGKPYQSVGLLANGTRHAFTSSYGRRPYDGDQTTAQATLFMQGIFGTTAHVWKAGLSWLSDGVSETLSRQTRTRQERVPGTFAEYTYQNSRNLTAVAGLRYDRHNLYGDVFTPRLSVKYDLTPTSTLRISGGSGFRVANPVAENAYALTSARAIVFLDDALRPERAWNVGGSATHYFEWRGRAGTLILDYYYTTFRNQVVADMYASPHALTFSNLRGVSYSRSMQAEVQYELVKGLQAKAAYKWYDVTNDYAGGYRLPRPLLPRHRAFVNLGYASAFDKWRFDLTAQWYGRRPLPGLDDHATNAAGVPLIRTSPHYALLNAQTTRAFKGLEVYAGVENLTNYRQSDPIVGADTPFGMRFDAGMVWGPIFGRMTYAGIRYTIK